MGQSSRKSPFRSVKSKMWIIFPEGIIGQFQDEIMVSSSTFGMQSFYLDSRYDWRRHVYINKP